MKENKIIILKVLVGSRSHGLADEKSDYDYRAVYVQSTSEILSIGHKYKSNDWIEGDEDNTSYEIGHFLSLAIKCNPTILEVFKAPVIESNEDGIKLQNLFQYIWNPQDSFNAFIGYGLNQRKKFLDKKDNRQGKYAIAYIRTLVNLIDLLYTGNFSMQIEELDIKNYLLDIKEGKYSLGEIIDYTEHLTKTAKNQLNNCKQDPNLQKINEYLLEIRKKYWSII